jgi:hypothetical protein
MSARSCLAWLALTLAGCACGDGGHAQVSDAERAVVHGTVVDAATRMPLEGARVTAPDGSRTRSDAAGRFRLDGLAPGLEGLLAAEGPGGLRGSVPLQPLRPGSLEVVLHLRRP